MWEGFFTGYLNYSLNCREKNEEIISRYSLPHYKRASSFTNKREAAWLHLLSNLSRYRRMSESVQHDEQGSSLHDRWCLRYNEQCSSLHAEGLITKIWSRKSSIMEIDDTYSTSRGRDYIAIIWFFLSLIRKKLSTVVKFVVPQNEGCILVSDSFQNLLHALRAIL